MGGDMIKVIIADDEPRVISLIESLIDWKALNLEVVGTANDGVEALQLVKQHSPSVVITDIRMPGYDAIQLIEKINEFKKDTNIVIISGYRYFEYAHSAIKYGVSDYLLKPIKKADLERTLKKIVDKIHLSQAEETQQQRNQQVINNAKEKLKKDFMLDVLFNDLEDNVVKKYTLEQLNLEYGLNLKPGLFNIFIIKVDYLSLDTMTDYTEILGKKTNEFCLKYLSKHCQEMIMYQSSKGIVLIINYQDDKNVKNAIKNIHKELLATRYLFGPVNVTIGVGKVLDDISNIKQSANSAISAIDNRIIDGHNRIITYQCEKKVAIIYNVVTYDFMSQLEKHIEVLDVEHVGSWFNKLYDKLSKNNRLTGEDVYECTKDIYDHFNIARKKINIVIDDEKTFFKEYDKVINNSSTLEVLITNIKAYLLNILNQHLTNKEQEELKPIREAKKYIQQNYMIHITLETVANHIGFNSAYFSSLFKEKTGKNFSAYLLEMRIEGAKELLKETNQDVASIAEMVGYSDSKYFSKQFKKVTGLKPSEYRKLY